ncbi:MAG: putative secreted protein, partial [Myxococcales bacterium]|nr:putative secreted protein [Myxococcales bacterium]
PAFDRARVAGDATYNLAAGTLILADKWRATNCVGDNQPRIVEDWYVAAWAYNGLAFSNNPNNPNYSATRGVCDTKAGCGARPYQERIFGWMEHPPSAQHWSALAVAYPDRADIPATGASVPDLPEPHCASPTDCATTRAVHVSACLDGSGGDMAGGIGGGTGGGDLGSGGGGKGGCGCDLGRAPPVHDAALVISALALLCALRYKKRA